MLTVLGNSQRFCDGVSRRGFLKIGALGVGGVMLPDVLRADELNPAATQKSIINIYLPGGPSHIDMFDLKPEAPPEIRGEFLPTKTNVPGMDICSLMPRLAQMADKFAIVRSVSGVVDEHSSHQTETGWPERAARSIGGRPSLGAVMAKVQGVTNGSVPTFMAMGSHTHHGFLGPVYSAYRPDGEGRSNLKIANGVTPERFASRAQLLAELDRTRRDMDGSHMMEAMDSFNQRALGVITSAKLSDALDWNKEDAATKERYGLHESARSSNSVFLTARRLVEAGVRCVSLSWGGWDTHGDNFKTLNRQLPALDVALSGLLGDLHDRGMLENTAVVMWGEFGRTPRVNTGGGRDHWSRAMSAFIAGGGMRMGQVIGSTNRYAEAPQDRPVHLQEIFATLYHVLGMDPKSTQLRDPNGRPQYLVEHPEPVRELVG